MTLYTLALEFDLNQCTRSLQYTFSNPETETGVLAGTFNFNPSGKPNDGVLETTLTVTGNISDNPSVTVVDCTLVSVSNGELGRTFLSPFNKSNAVSKFSDWPLLSKNEAPAGRVKLFAGSGTKLPVVAPRGQWEISGYLSVIIELNGVSYNRVFTFDPEGTAGGGSLFP